MPKASKETGLTRRGRWAGRYEELGGSTVGFESFREDADTTALFKGFRDDRCQSPQGLHRSWQGHVLLRGPPRGLRDGRRLPRAAGPHPADLAWLGMDGPVPGVHSDDYEPDAAICAFAVRDGVARGARGFVTDIEAPSETMDTPAYESFARLGFRRPYVRTHFARLS